MEKGWSIKHIHRLILNSAVYRQSSKVTPKLLEVDPYNRWLARAPRIRVEAEIVRDVASGRERVVEQKDRRPSVLPALPAGVMDLAYGGFRWENATGEDRYRRGMYTFWKRTVPYPSMLVFDSPNGDFSCAPSQVEHAAAGADDLERHGLCGSGSGAGLASLEKWRRR